jgi:uracil-DNA glycosylase
MLLAAQDPLEADGLAAWTAARRPWPGVLDEERAKPYFRDVLRFVTAERAKRRSDVYPADSDVFAAFHLTPFDAVKVVILGQDPYPNPGQAMGLSFSVPRGVRLPTSLVNIHAAMRTEGLTPPEHGDLTGWARQGVFMLNTALTVPRGAAGKHLAAWRPFTDAVIRVLSARDQPVVFVLWGAKAQRVLRRQLIDTDRHGVVVAPHPAARAAAQTRFRQAQTFTKVNNMLRDLGNKTVDWTDV